MHKKFSFLVSMPFMGILLVLFIVVLAIATFVESAYGASTSWAVIYGTHWFELLMLVMAINIAGVMFKMRFFTRRKLVVLVFHLAFIVILAGAAITRFISYEGIMHIREQSISNTMLSDNGYVQVVFEANGQKVESEKEVMISELTPKDYRMSTSLGVEKVKIRSTGYMSNGIEQWVASPGGVPYLQVALVTEQQNSVGLTSGSSRSVLGFTVSFNNNDTTALLRFVSDGNQVFLHAPFAVTSMQMSGADEIEYQAWEAVPIMEGSLYGMGNLRLALQGFIPSAVKRLVRAPAGETGYISAVSMEIKFRGMSSEVNVPGMVRRIGEPVSGQMGDLKYSITYGSKELQLPFSLFLKDFQVERYPGSHSPSSFASEVVLVDKEMDFQQDYRIFMNNVLKHRGFRFYQSSYDTDEKGTVLSVNKDLAGTYVTYTGYLLLIAGMILAMFVKNTRFSKFASRTNSAVKTLLVGALILGAAMPAFSQQVPPKEVAEEFGSLWVQSKGGRFEPMNTLSSEVVRKITKKSSFNDYTADQVMLGLILYPDAWKAEPLFKVKNPELHRTIGYKGEMISFNHLMDETTGAYLLSDLVNAAFSKEVASQTDLDKEVIKLDDRVNAMYLVQSGALITIFPDKNSENHKWLSLLEVVSDHAEGEHEEVSTLFLQCMDAVRAGDYGASKTKLDILKQNQVQNETLLPAESKKKLEIKYNRINLFPRLAKFYGLFGVILMALQFLLVFRPKKLYSYLFNIGIIHLAVAFAIHTLVLVVRWYISGHAPMSNGYESMIFVAWVTILAGLIFVKRSGYAMALTAILAALSLMVAGMSNMNPEITNLVPVLKSPWLTIHVAVIMAGYGFLGLASIMGLMNVVLYASLTPSNKGRIQEVINSVSDVNQMTLIVGLYFMTAGVFLGGVWANESWGRYWGWDPKETWALITVLVYAFVTHMHRIPGLRGTFAFNMASFVSYSSVMMTYFGVNYFLGGIHSYASGSAFKVPVAVYIALAVLTLLSFFAYRQWNKHLPDAAAEEE
ncbi:MAG: cytochrome c biogenesis protein CcsA [Bacteroidetes bacterium]|nr:cytochrome c biogenesis protein CcsA [Bacteroidota bacterium]